MQMGERLTQRKGHLMAVERAPEQHRHQRHRALGIAARGNDFRATRPVVRRQIIDSGV
jgi:hypothetical protein